MAKAPTSLRISSIGPIAFRQTPQINRQSSFLGGEQHSLLSYYQRSIGLGADAGQEAVPYQTLVMAFRDMLPAPPLGTPFQEVLEFKARRADQLKQLHIAIDHLAVQLSGVPSADDAVRVGRQTIEGAFAEIDKVFSERLSSRILSTLQTNLGSIATGAILGAAAAPTAELSMVAGAFLGGSSKPLLQATINAVVGPKKLSEKAAPYLYAYQAQRELRPR